MGSDSPDSEGLANHVFVCLFVCFGFFRATLTAYGSSQARGGIRAAAAGLHHSYSNTGFEPHLQSSSRLAGMPDP